MAIANLTIFNREMTRADVDPFFASPFFATPFTGWFLHIGLLTLCVSETDPVSADVWIGRGQFVTHNEVSIRVTYRADFTSVVQARDWLEHEARKIACEMLEIAGQVTGLVPESFGGEAVFIRSCRFVSSEDSAAIESRIELDHLNHELAASAEMKR
jgi:hypothetical protein